MGRPYRLDFAGGVHHVMNRGGNHRTIFHSANDATRFLELACAGRYIHRNPLDFRPQEPLDEYRWSSYRYFVTSATAPEWLSTSELLDPIGGPASYRSFVERETDRSILEWAIDTAILEAERDDVAVPNIKRTVMLAMLASADSPLAERLGRLVTFPSDGARYMAMSRMRRHVAADPAVAAIAERALRLAA